jgi:UDP-glucose 4-epimerase
MRWLITGGTGFIGSNLIAKIRAKAGDTNQIAVYDNLSDSTIGNFRATDGIGDVRVVSTVEPLWNAEPGTVNLVVGDIRDADRTARAFEGADIVVHLAANTGVQPSVANPRLDCETNVIGVLNCLEAARHGGASRFVFASSGAPIGLCEPPITELSAPRPASPYGASKLAGEAYCCAYSSAFGLSTVALRFSNVYGPYSWRKGSVVAKFIKTALAGNELVINGDGSQTRDFVFVDDLTSAIILAATKEGIGGELFQISTGIETSVSDLLELMRGKLENMGAPKVRVRYGERGAGDVMRNYADPAKALRMLGWAPQYALSDGLDRTLAWFDTAWKPEDAVAGGD